MKWVIAGTYLSVVICFTTCSRGTGWSDTKGFAVSCLKVAFLIKGAVIIGLTAYFCARDKWIALQASRANTDSFVSFWLANCSTSTNCEWTRIHTLVRLAGFVIWAVVITSTIHYGEKGNNYWMQLVKARANERKTYIQSTLGADCQPNFPGICILVCGLKFCKWHFCHRDQNHMGQHSSFQCRLQMWDTHHHVDIHQF